MAKNLLIALKKNFILLIFLLLSFSVYSQNAIVGDGFSTGWDNGSCNDNSNFKYLTAATAGSGYILTTAASGTGDRYFRLGSDWGASKYSVSAGGSAGTNNNVVPNTTYTVNGICDTSGTMKYNVGSTSYNYIFKTSAAGTVVGGNNFVFFEVKGAVRSVSSSTRTNPIPNTNVTVTANLSGVLSAGQSAYLRYSTNGFSTSVVVPMTLSSGSLYTAIIPSSVNTSGTAVSYYIFTSGDANVASDGSNADFYTINLNNNSGANYSYTVTTNPVSVESTGGTNTFANYATLAAAITSINGGTIHTGTITAYVNTGYNETAPSGGYSITASGTAANPIKFIKNGTGASPVFTANSTLTSGSLTDAVFKIIGGDYITIDGFTMKENSNTNVTPSSNNMTEWGVALLYASTTNGAQNNTIQNCTISLNKSYSNTFGIYSNTRHSATNVLTTAEVTSATGANSNNKIYANNISNVNYGISFTGAGSTLSAIDTGNDIGGTSNALGNVISNLGAAIAGSSFVSLSTTSYGAVMMNQQINDNVSYNNIAAGTVTSAVTVNGILKFYSVASPTSGTITSNINNNTVSITNNASTNAPNTYSIVGINSQGLSVLSTASFNINNNIIQNSTLGGSASTTSNIAGFWLSLAPGVLNVTGNTVSNFGITSTASTTGNVYGVYVDSTVKAVTANYNNNTISNLYINSSSATSGTIYGIYNSAANTNLSISSNTIKGNSSTAVSGGFSGITNTGAVTASINLNNNLIGDSASDAITFSKAASGSVYCVNNTSAGSSSALSISGNDFRGFVHSTAGTSAYNFINNTGTVLSETISNNTFTNLNLVTTGDIYLINNSYTAPSNGSKTIQNNSVVTGFSRNGSSGAFYGYYDFGSSTSSVSHIISGNNFSNINTGTSTGSFYGIFSSDYSTTSNIPALNVSSNTVSNNITAGSFAGIYLTGFAGTAAVPNKVNDNTVSNNITTSTSTSQYGLYVGAVGLYVNTYNNTINANAINASGTFSGIFASGTSNNNKYYNNTITNSTSSTTGNLIGIYVNLGTKVDIYQNIINTFSSGGNVFGILINGGTLINVYDHKNSGTNYSIYGLSTSGTANSAEGIRISGGTTVNTYQNEIYNITGSSTVTPVISGIDISGGGANVYKNKIYNISITGTITGNYINLVNGILIQGGSGTIYNNTIGSITAPNVSMPYAVNGIYINGTAGTAHKIYFNTIYLNANSSGTNFGSTGIYHTYSSTSTTSSLDLRNNIIINKSTPKGTGKTAAFRRSAATDLNNYAATSNNNIFYAGVPGANNLIFSDFTNNDQTITAFQTRVSARENLSYTEDVTFQSTVPTDANYLRIADGTSSFAESGGAATSSPSVGDDFWGTARTTYDIGASEFAGVKKVPSITSVSPSSICIGGTLTITGANLNNAIAANIKIGGMPVSSVTSNDGSTLVVVIGSGTTGTVSVTNNLGTAVSSSAVTVLPAPSAAWASNTSAACQNSFAQTVTLAYTGTSNSPVSYSITWNASPANSFVTVTDQANTFASGSGVITVNVPANTPAGTYTGNVTVKNANSCISSSSSPFTLTVNNTPTNVSLTTTLSPAAADFCSLDYVKLEAAGGVIASNIIIGTGTSAVGITSYPNPLSAYYGGAKHQMIYLASELSAQGLIAGSSISTIGLYINAFVAADCNNLTIRMKNSSTSALAGFESGTTTVYGGTTFTPNASGWANFNLTTPFVWDGSSNLIVEFVHNAGNSGNGSGTTVRYTSTTGVNSTYYGAKDGVTGGIAGFDSLTSYSVSGASTLRPNIQFGYSAQKITWTPIAGLFTDTALTIPYSTGVYTSVVYAAPSSSTSYTAKSTLGSCDKIAVTPSLVRLKKEFRGTVNSDWSIAANWFPAQVPDNSKCASIPAGKTVAIDVNDAEAKSIIIASTGKVTISANNSLKVTDAVNITNNTNNDNLTLESDAVLLQDNAVTNTGNILAKRATHIRKMDYTYWSTPVTGQKLLNDTALNDGFSVGTPNNRIYYYYEPNDTFKSVTENYFINAKGYAVRGKDSYLATDPANNPVADEFKFIGVPNNGNYSINIQKSANTGTGGTIEHGYNLIGNPYPSNIDFVKFFYLGNNKNIINAKAWFWTNVTPVINQDGSAYNGNNYATITLTGGTPPTYFDVNVIPSPVSGSYVPTKNIKAGQGFIVQAKNLGTGQTLTFDNTIRTKESGLFFNSRDSSQINRYWLKLTSPAKIVNTILIGHLDGATDQYDADYDADLLALGDDSFYSKLNTQKLQIQARSNPLNINDVIPLGAKYSSAGIYKISLENKEGVFDTYQKIYLVDKFMNTYTDLTTQDYSFSANKGTDETRFEIVYKNREVLTANDTKKQDFVVYKDGEYFVIKSSNILGRVELYDSSGKLIDSRNSSQKDIHWDAHTLPSGVYIFKTENSGNIRTKKVIK